MCAMKTWGTKQMVMGKGFVGEYIKERVSSLAYHLAQTPPQ